jgi:integrase
MSCIVKLGARRKDGGSRKLAFRLYFNGITSWEGMELIDTPQDRDLAEAKALLISHEMNQGVFDYLAHFPNGNKAYLFRPDVPKPKAALTVRAYYQYWIKKQTARVRPHRIKDYESQFRRHILDTKTGNVQFGNLPLQGLTVDRLKNLQDSVKAKNMKAATVNAVVHSSLRALLRDARGEGFISVDLYDRAFFKPLPLTDTEGNIDSYTPEERELILQGFKEKRRHFHAFVFHQFWTGSRPSETTALRWGQVDLLYSRFKVQRSRVQGHEAGTKTKRSNREVIIHENLFEVLTAHRRSGVEQSIPPLHVDPDSYVFTTLEGAPVDEENFYNREWLPMLRRLNIRPRPFYNTRHSYASFMLSIGARVAFVAAQIGDSTKTVETNYAKYLPEADFSRQMIEGSIAKSEIEAKYAKSEEKSGQEVGRQAIKKGLRNQPLKSGAGERDRTADLMLGKHTL